MPATRLRFYGAAVAAHQADGGDDNSDWSRWLKSIAPYLAENAADMDYGQGKLTNLQPEAFNPENYETGEAVDHYNRFEEDYDLAAQIELNAHRLTFRWPLIEPHPGQYDPVAIEHCRKQVRYLRKLGIEPFATLWHFELPLWAELKGGWESAKVRHRFTLYALKMVEELQDDVTYWATFSEPDTYTMLAYLPKWLLPNSWLDYPRGWRHFFAVRRRFVQVHRQTYVAIKERFPGMQVGVEPCFAYYDGWSDPISKLVRWVMKSFSNDYFAPRMAEHSDWLGLHYYFHCRVKMLPFRNDFMKTSDLGWDLYPWGLGPLLDELGRFKKPIMVEVGLANGNDQYRWWYLQECLANCYGAIRRGVICLGLIDWALTDNIELDKGRWGGRFGLVAIDYDHDLKRSLRPSALKLRDHIRRMKKG